MKFRDKISSMGSPENSFHEILKILIQLKIGVKFQNSFSTPDLGYFTPF